VGSASGGAPATGGLPGTAGHANGGNGGAGATGTGGSPGTGGMTGTGGTGTGASGGRGGAGAVIGSGGTGAIGSGGTGATGSGGRPGSGGTSGSGGATAMCDEIANDYRAALPSAQACNTVTGLTVPQCQKMTPASLGCGSTCIIYVQDSTKLSEIQKRWNSLDCQSIIRTCPAVLCVDAKPGNCYASAGSAAASCQNLPK